MTHRSRSAMERRQPTAGKPHSGSENPSGGREFGQVIEPMQAQMASGNEGLADTSGSKRSSRSATRKSSSEKKRKAA